MVFFQPNMLWLFAVAVLTIVISDNLVNSKKNEKAKLNFNLLKGSQQTTFSIFDFLRFLFLIT